MAMVNMNNLLNGKDSRWLQLEVCREFQRNKCSRPDTECKFAHPPANVEVQNGRVTACYDSIKGRCNRDKPPCKYFHPPQHLKDQLLINGRNHLALKNALMQQMGLTPGQPLISGQLPAVVGGKLQFPTPPLNFGQLPLGLMMPRSTMDWTTVDNDVFSRWNFPHCLATAPYLPGMPQVGSTFSPYFSPGPVIPAMMGPDPTGQLGMVQQTVVTQQKLPRSDRLEPSVSVGLGLAAPSTAPDLARKRPRDPSDDFLLAFPGMVPYKRAAGEKSGVPVYQPSATAYQQLLQPFVPVSCEYRAPPPPAPALAAFTGIPLNKQAVQPQPSTSAFLPNPFAAIAAFRPPHFATAAHHHPAPQASPLITDLLAATVNNNNNNDDDLQPYKKMKTT